MTIAPLPQGVNTFWGPNGEILSGGSVTNYIPGTTTLKATWQDPNQSALNTNPITLSANGSCVIYGWGAYRQIVKDSSGNTISDSVTFGGSQTQTFVTFKTPGSSNFTVPAGIYSLYVEVVAGGGGGSQCKASTATGDVSGAGGGAGGFANGIYAVTPGQVISYSVGAGGSTQNAGTGTNFGSFLSASSGQPGSFTSGGTSQGGVGGAATGGTILNLGGGYGTDGSHIPPSGGQPYIGPGNGGASFYGAGGTSVNGATAHAGVAPGSGGAGPMDVNLTGVTFSGGAGADGQILISYWS